MSHLHARLNMHFNLVHFTPSLGLCPLYKNASKYHTIMQLKTQPNATQLHNWKRNQMQKRNMFAQLKTQHDYAIENDFRKRFQKKYVKSTSFFRPSIQLCVEWWLGTDLSSGL